jgi:hypothetical protein
MWSLTCVVWRHCAYASCVDTKKTLLLYCWPRVLLTLPSNGFTCHIIFHSSLLHYIRCLFNWIMRCLINQSS